MTTTALTRLHRSDEVFGPLAPYLVDPAVTDLFVNGHRELWVDRGAGAARDPSWTCPGEDALRAFAVRLVARGGRHLDEATPCVDVEVEGVRVHVVLPPIAVGGTVISVRVPGTSRPDLDDLARRGLFGAGPAGLARRAFVEQAVRDRVNLLVTGAGGSGKTTFLAALLGAADPADRLVVIEDVAELRVEHPHVVSLEARQPNLEGAGGIGLAELVRQALRMRPDRLVLGECRGAEIRDLLAALNTGHDGGAGTLHANAIADVPARLEALGALAGLDAAALARQTVSAVGLVLHLRRTPASRTSPAPTPTTRPPTASLSDPAAFPGDPTHLRDDAAGRAAIAGSPSIAGAPDAHARSVRVLDGLGRFALTPSGHLTIVSIPLPGSPATSASRARRGAAPVPGAA
ncbi:TadA family conjugal transfer-associated ATPase [Herbiconiux sp. VKM Ac-1786]|uniref:TadA family conjugal transfer-associated ATPase n=1 Tax=Herbiconiux sp. VKM Ac-1786 TaxID=2783824 RepID=UPI00351C2C64